MRPCPGRRRLRSVPPPPPIIRIVQVNPPHLVCIDASDFRSTVQTLTGCTTTPPSPSSSSSSSSSSSASTSPALHHAPHALHCQPLHPAQQWPTSSPAASACNGLSTPLLDAEDDRHSAPPPSPAALQAPASSSCMAAAQLHSPIPASPAADDDAHEDSHHINHSGDDQYLRMMQDLGDMQQNYQLQQTMCLDYLNDNDEDDEILHIRLLASARP